MKKCPYCAEMIQDEAKFCRYCGRKVRGRWVGPAVKLFIAAGLIVLVITHMDEIKNMKQGYRRFAADSKEIWQSLKDGAKYVKRIEKDKRDGNIFEKLLKRNSSKEGDTPK